LLLPLLPHAAMTATTDVARASEPKSELRAVGRVLIVFSSAWLQRSGWARDKRTFNDTPRPRRSRR
jgi:hypothetical protein